MEKYAALYRPMPEEEKLLPIDRSGVARIIELSSRFADNQEKLSTKFSAIHDLVRESNYWAKKAK